MLFIALETASFLLAEKERFTNSTSRLRRSSAIAHACSAPSNAHSYLLHLLPSWGFSRLLSLKQTNSANKKSNPVGLLFLLANNCNFDTKTTPRRDSTAFQPHNVL